MASAPRGHAPCTSGTPLGCRSRITARACSMVRTSCQLRLPVTSSRNGWRMCGHLRCLLLACHGCVSAQTPPLNPIAARPHVRRVLSRVGGADHAVTPQAPWTGSCWRGYSYGGFGGGHPQFLPHAPDLVTRRFPYRHPHSFRSVRHLDGVLVGCPFKSREPGSRSSLRLPAGANGALSWRRSSLGYEPYDVHLWYLRFLPACSRA